MNTRNREASTSSIFIEPVDGFPDLLALHEANSQRYPYLLESVAHGNQQARYDILFAFPGESLVLDADMRLHADKRQPDGNDFLSNLDAWWQEERQPSSLDQELPFRGGWFVFLAYELAGQVEPVLDLPHGEKLLPTAFGQLQCSQRQNTTGAIILPTRPGNTHTLFDQSLTGSLRYTAANRKIVITVISVTHFALIIVIIPNNLTNFFITFYKIFPVKIGSPALKFF